MSALSFDADVIADENSLTANAVPAILDRNWQTTAAVALSVGTGGLAGGVMLAAFPAQTLAVGSAIGGLAYAGHRKHEGLPINPWQKSADQSTVDTTVTPAADPA